MLKKIVSICITAALCLTMSSPVFASEIHFDQSAADTNENGRMLVDETILQIQEELSVNNTTVGAMMSLKYVSYLRLSSSSAEMILCRVSGSAIFFSVFLPA